MKKGELIKGKSVVRTRGRIKYIRFFIVFLLILTLIFLVSTQVCMGKGRGVFTAISNFKQLESDKAVVNIEKEEVDCGGYNYIAVVRGLDEDNNVIWEYKTPEGQVGQLDFSSGVFEDVNNEDKVFFTACGVLYCLNKQSGQCYWTLDNIGGSNKIAFIDKNTLAITSFLEQPLTIIKYDDTLIDYSTFNYDEIAWITDIEYKNNYLVIYYDSDFYDNSPSELIEVGTDKNGYPSAIAYIDLEGNLIDYRNIDKNVDESNNKDSENEVSDLIYDANYSLDYNVDYDLKRLNVPYINISGDSGNRINNEIYNLFCENADENPNPTDENPWYVNFDYIYTINDDILSVLIVKETGGTAPPDYKCKTYNINIKTGEEIKCQELLEVKEIDKVEFFKAVSIKSSEKIEEIYQNSDNIELMEEDQMKTSESMETQILVDNNANLFLNDQGEVCIVILEFESILQAGQYEEVYVYKDGEIKILEISEIISEKDNSTEEDNVLSDEAETINADDDYTRALVAYAELLLSFNPESDEAGFLLGYIDDDGIPELFIFDGLYHASQVDIYTFYNGEVKYLGGFGSNATVSFKEKGNLVLSSYAGQGNWYDTFYKIIDGEMVYQYELLATEVFDEELEEVVVKYYVNNEIVSQEVYNSYRAEDIESLTTYSIDISYEINDSNIEEVLR